MIVEIRLKGIYVNEQNLILRLVLRNDRIIAGLTL